MESTKCTPSVIAKLMGLDDQPPQQPVRKRQRVLSEIYLERSAMLGMYARHVLISCHSSGIASTSKQKLRQNTPSSDKERSWTKNGRSTSSLANGFSVGLIDGKQIFDKWRKMKSAEATKLGDVRHSIGEILNFMDNELKNTTLCKQSSQHSSKLHSNNSLGTISYNYLRGEQVLLSDIDEHCNTAATPRASQSIIESGSDLSVGGKGSKPCHNTKNDTTSGHAICRLSGDLDRDSDIMLPLEGSQAIHDDNESPLEKKHLLDDFSLVKSILSPMSGTTAAVHQRNGISITPSEFQELLSATLTKHHIHLEVSATSSVQTNEEDFDIPDFTRVDSEFPRTSRDINQPSPNSVLEPNFPDENTLVSEALGSAADDFCGLAMQFHGLNSKSEDTYSELGVSSDEDCKEVSDHFTHDTRKTLELYGTEESRNFSYLLDILDEADLTWINSEHYLKAWHSLEYLVDLSIFEVLEKKYGKQTSWQRSERRLLFDRINAGLKEILNVQIGICSLEMPQRRIFTGTLGRNELEEELWMLLTREEKDACNDLSIKGLEPKWLQLSEDIQNICRDIEYDLFIEIVGEIATIAGL